MAAVTARPDAVPAQQRAGLAASLRPELTKMRSVRSTYWSQVLLVLASLAWSVAFCTGEASRWPHMSAQDKLGFDPAQARVLGLASLGQLVLVVLGPVTCTSDA